MTWFKVKIKGWAKLMQFNKVPVIGLVGQLGLPVAKYVKERGFDTYGYNISIKAMEHAKKTSFFLSYCCSHSFSIIRELCCCINHHI